MIFFFINAQLLLIANLMDCRKNLNFVVVVFFYELKNLIYLATLPHNHDFLDRGNIESLELRIPDSPRHI